jgi:hypothetical protein
MHQELRWKSAKQMKISKVELQTWRRESWHFTICSCFPGICVSTSTFSLLNTKGRIMPCSRLINSSFLVALPSIIWFIGFENQYENSFRSWNMCGMRKCSNDHNSIRLFWKKERDGSRSSTTTKSIRRSTTETTYLQRSARQKEPPLGVKVNKRLPSLTLKIFYIVSFIKN